ncbi:MAG: glycoside hydrolase family 57 protein [Methylococcaceae bacterium]|jgi:alpha-amylase/alpha-mannosidase (GH57 family)
MLDKQKLKLVICWHMHQPEYRDLHSGEFKLPWTYLHVMKDYVDMVAHLEAAPQAKVVVNFAPILLEQIEEYARQINSFLHDRSPFTDSLLAALSDDAELISNPAKIIKDCLKANRERQINRYPQFKHLAETAELFIEKEIEQYANAQFIADLLMWYHLAWLGETVKLSDKRAQRLLAQGGNYTFEDRLEMLIIIADQLSHVLGRYKILAKKGQIELSVTPYSHPIMPLLLDINTTHEATPHAPLPELKAYPNGEERVLWHLEKGMQTFKRFFGFEPTGCWPSEGSVSDETVRMLDKFGFKWTASGGSVLGNSLNHAENDRPESTFHPFQLKGSKINCFFRDDGLSDLIGFQYSKWHADDAVSDLINHLEHIADREIPDAVVSIIMDGENAWEYFPENGIYFLSALYRRLSNHPRIEMTTFDECVKNNVKPKPLNKLVAGSWVYGTFSTWIGDTDKNRGWDMLGDAKKMFDRVITNEEITPELREKANLQLAVCEGSDWFWWFGDYNPSDAVSSFEKQFRLNIANLYYLLGEDPPGYLALSFTQGSGAPAMGGTMRQGTEH